jgi:hypothetical protein
MPKRRAVASIALLLLSICVTQKAPNPLPQQQRTAGPTQHLKLDTPDLVDTLVVPNSSSY